MFLKVRASGSFGIVAVASLATSPSVSSSPPSLKVTFVGALSGGTAILLAFSMKLKNPVRSSVRWVTLLWGGGSCDRNYFAQYIDGARFAENNYSYND